MRRQRRCQHAQGPGHEHPGVRSQLQRRREPVSKQGQRRHQACRNAHADDEPRGYQLSHVASQRETDAPGNGHQQQAHDHALGAVAVQGCAQWQLHGREAQEVGPGQQAQLPGTQAEFGAEDWRQRGRHGTQQGREKVGYGKGHEHRCRTPAGERGHRAVAHGTTFNALTKVLATPSSATPPSTTAWYTCVPRENQTACPCVARPSGR